MSKAMLRDPETCKVAAVFGNVVKIYGPSRDGFRPAKQETYTFANYGQARVFAQTFDEKEQLRQPPAAR